MTLKTSIRIGVVLALSVVVSGCIFSTPYIVAPQTGSKYKISKEGDSFTSRRNGIVVTVGPLVQGYRADINFGFLITNISKRNIKTSFDKAVIRVNGKPIRLYTIKDIKKYARYDRISAGLAAGSASLARSTQGGYGVSEQKYQSSRTDFGQRMFEIAWKYDQDKRRLGYRESKRLGKIQSVVWKDSAKLRSHMARTFSLAKQYYWRDEIIKPKQQALRMLWVYHTETKKFTASNKIVVELTIGRNKYRFPFRALARAKPK